MTSFSSLLSSLGDRTQDRPATVSPTSNPLPNGQPNGLTNRTSDRFQLTPNNAAAGVKRQAERIDSTPKAKVIKTEPNALSNHSPAPTTRFQLSAKSDAPRSSVSTIRAPNTVAASSSTHANQTTQSVSKPTPKTGPASTPNPPGNADASAKPKKGFASILEKAKAAQAAAQVANVGGIKHKPVERLSRKERLKIQEEEEAAKLKAGRKGRLLDRSRSTTPLNGTSNSAPKKNGELGYKGTMKKPPEPLAYKGTMKPAGSGPKPPVKKGQPQDKYGGYASWSELDDAEEDEGGGYYDDDESDDMEGGFDELEAEENAALRAAKKEDQEAIAEEERLKREKLERKRRLQALTERAAAKRKF